MKEGMQVRAVAGAFNPMSVVSSGELAHVKLRGSQFRPRAAVPSRCRVDRTVSSRDRARPSLANRPGPSGRAGRTSSSSSSTIWASRTFDSYGGEVRTPNIDRLKPPTGSGSRGSTTPRDAARPARAWTRAVLHQVASSPATVATCSAARPPSPSCSAPLATRPRWRASGTSPRRPPSTEKVTARGISPGSTTRHELSTAPLADVRPTSRQPRLPAPLRPDLGRGRPLRPVLAGRRDAAGRSGARRFLPDRCPHGPGRRIRPRDGADRATVLPLPRPLCPALAVACTARGHRPLQDHLPRRLACASHVAVPPAGCDGTHRPEHAPLASADRARARLGCTRWAPSRTGIGDDGGPRRDDRPGRPGDRRARPGAEGDRPIRQHDHPRGIGQWGPRRSGTPAPASTGPRGPATAGPSATPGRSSPGPRPPGGTSGRTKEQAAEYTVPILEGGRPFEEGMSHADDRPLASRPGRRSRLDHRSGRARDRPDADLSRAGGASPTPTDSPGTS